MRFRPRRVSRFPPDHAALLVSLFSFFLFVFFFFLQPFFIDRRACLVSAECLASCIHEIVRGEGRRRGVIVCFFWFSRLAFLLAARKRAKKKARRRKAKLALSKLGGDGHNPDAGFFEGAEKLMEIWFDSNTDDYKVIPAVW